MDGRFQPGRIVETAVPAWFQGSPNRDFQYQPAFQTENLHPPTNFTINSGSDSHLAVPATRNLKPETFIQTASIRINRRLKDGLFS